MYYDILSMLHHVCTCSTQYVVTCMCGATVFSGQLLMWNDVKHKVVQRYIGM